jgi:hypothetical protein
MWWWAHLTCCKLARQGPLPLAHKPTPREYGFTCHTVKCSIHIHHTPMLLHLCGSSHFSLPTPHWNGLSLAKPSVFTCQFWHDWFVIVCIMRKHSKEIKTWENKNCPTCLPSPETTLKMRYYSMAVQTGEDNFCSHPLKLTPYPPILGRCVVNPQVVMNHMS